MLNKKEKKVLIASLPDDWKQRAAGHFGKSNSLIEKVAYGTTENIEVFEYLVAMAEDNKLAIATKTAELKERISNLAKPISA